MYPFLLSKILRGNWFLRPEDAIAGHVIVNNFLTGVYNDEKYTKILSEISPLQQLSYEGESLYDKTPAGSTAIIPVKGTLIKYGTFCSYGADEIAEQIRSAARHKNISSLVLDIDSGGGACDAVAPVCSAIEDVRKSGKAVVASCDLAASAAYWIACNCDRIVADNDVSAEFGSIGVMCSFSDLKPIYEKMGVKFHEIYADQSENKNEAFRLALEGDYTKIKQESLNPMAVRFQNEVKSRRGNLKLDTPGILAGKMFYAGDALKTGLIDEIGSLERAVEVAKNLSEEMNIINQYINS